MIKECTDLTRKRRTHFWQNTKAPYSLHGDGVGSNQIMKDKCAEIQALLRNQNLTDRMLGNDDDLKRYADQEIEEAQQQNLAMTEDGQDDEENLANIDGKSVAAKSSKPKGHDTFLLPPLQRRLLLNQTTDKDSNDNEEGKPLNTKLDIYAIIAGTAGLHPAQLHVQLSQVAGLAERFHTN